MHFWSLYYAFTVLFSSLPLFKLHNCSCGIKTRQRGRFKLLINSMLLPKICLDNPKYFLLIDLYNPCKEVTMPLSPEDEDTLKVMGTHDDTWYGQVCKVEIFLASCTVFLHIVISFNFVILKMISSPYYAFTRVCLRFGFYFLLSITKCKNCATTYLK